ncbi:MAG: winged helix-turn-helix domain-containing protein [Burkholderiales bacterium]|nr:winged helix-turn-helix domain-containing protein [Burkholderiales bacterium]
MSRILYIDNESGVADFVALSLRHDGHEVWHAVDSDQAHRLIAIQLPDLALIGSMLPDDSGEQFTRALRSTAHTHDLPIVTMTARNNDIEMNTALDAGADDCLPKPFSVQELLARMRAVLLRKLPAALDLPVEVGGLKLDPSTRRVSHAGKDIRLGPTEFRLLHFLLSNPERVHSRTQLLDRVWGDKVFIAERTVDVHIKRLRKGLAPAQCAALVETVRGAGYRLSALAMA